MPATASRLLGRWRTSGAHGLLHALAFVGRFSPASTPNGLHRIPVLRGPLGGRSLAIASLNRASFSTGTYQRHVLEAMKAHVRPGDVVYDVGAHCGYFTLVLAGLVGRSGRVVAFEPDPRNITALQTNTASEPNVTIAPAAVSDLVGQVTFATFDLSSISHIADSRTPGDARRLQVDCLTIDSFVFEAGHPPPAFIKIDVEGAEERVLRGCQRVLAECRPVIVVEVRGAKHWDEVAELARDAGYTARILGAGEDGLHSAGYGDALLIPAPSRGD